MPEVRVLDKGQSVTITVDGSEGTQLNPGNGVILQVMDDDDPGSTTGSFTVPTESPAKNESWDVTSTSGGATATFSNIDLEGDFYNAARGDSTGGAGGAPDGGSAPPEGSAPPGDGTPPDDAGSAPPGGSSAGGGGLNMVLTFDNSTITGVISASEARYADGVTTITEENYQELGNVTNDASPAVNNGVIVSLTEGSTWVVEGTSYLTTLTVSTDSAIAAPAGQSVSMTVDGVRTEMVPGNTYVGAIVLTVG